MRSDLPQISDDFTGWPWVKETTVRILLSSPILINNSQAQGIKECMLGLL